MEIHIYTDGGCMGNPGPGGWAYTIVRQRGSVSEVIVEKWGAQAGTTNNRMELIAALKALEMFYKLNISPKQVILFTDSQYLQMGITQWIQGWKRNGWRTSDKKAVKNQDLWNSLDELAARFPITWEWVRGHTGNQFNERCDKLTQRAIASLGKK
jgi:ribonuclease HI